MPVRILHIVTYMGRGGLETLLMNCFRTIDRNQIQFDFLVHRDFRADYDDEIEALGGRIYRIPRLNPANPGYFRALYTFFKSHPEYRIVHSHLDCMSALPLSVAKQCGVPVRIAHSHSASQNKNWKYFLKRFYMKKIPGNATHFFACSSDAASWMFPGQQATIINNGIQVDSFRYQPDVRDHIRSELSLSGCFVVGHTGRFAPEKNHSFLIDVFSHIHSKNPKSILMLIGTGDLEAQMRQKVASLSLQDSVLFLGSQSNVSGYLQAMDAYVMPSKYEGLSIAAVEAQASGLPCFFSDTIPAECKMTENVHYLSLNLPAEQWADAILEIDPKMRTTGHGAVRNAGFDISMTSEYLQSFYLENW